MADHRDLEGTGHSVDVFISYAPTDERWAVWVAWSLEAAGFTTMVQAWDFLPGANYLDFIDRGIREATIILPILSRSYGATQQSRLERMATEHAVTGSSFPRAVPVVVEESAADVGFASLDMVDLVDAGTEEEAVRRLLAHVRRALSRQPWSRLRSTVGTRVTADLPGAPLGDPDGLGTDPLCTDRRVRRVPVTPPVFPPYAHESRRIPGELSILHITATRFGRGVIPAGAPLGPEEMQARILARLAILAAGEPVRPDLILVAGDLTESGTIRQFDQALRFLVGLRSLLGLDADRLVVVPGKHDVTRMACEAYFAACEADDVVPEPPYFPKWRHFTRMFSALYQGQEGPQFDVTQCWTLFWNPHLHTAVAGLNSTMAMTHHPEDDHGWLGDRQVAWFANHLGPLRRSGQFRIAILNHVPDVHAGPAAVRPDVLRDSMRLEELLAPQVNLVLHGPDPTSTQVRRLPSGVPLVPPPDSGVQVLRIQRDGYTRWPMILNPHARPAEPEHVEHTWTDADRIFVADRGPGPVTLRAGLHPVSGLPGEPDPVGDEPTQILLTRIVEVCEARHERAQVHRLPGPPPSVRVTFTNGPFAHQYQVAAHVGCPTLDDVTAFVQALHAVGTDPEAELVYEGPPPGIELREEALRRGVRVRSFTEFQGLIDLRSYVARQNERLRADRRYMPEMYVPQRFRDLLNPSREVQPDVIEEIVHLLAEDDSRFIMLMGDFGRGKTFAMRQLALQLPTRLPRLTPLLIDLRALDKANSVDGLVAAHLANHGESRIDLRALRYLVRQGRLVLLFDGFDELVARVSYERAADHLNVLLGALQDSTKIVVASRSQHFKTDSQVLTSLGEHVGLLPQRKIIVLEDFTPAQSRAYLYQRYGQDQAAVDRRFALIERVADLAALSRNPRMLSFIADLGEERLAAVVRSGAMLSAAGLYREILENWLAYEHARSQDTKGAASGLSVEDLWRAVNSLAVRLWLSDESLLELAEISDVVRYLVELPDDPTLVSHATHAVGAGTLLVRTEDGLFGFIHSSVMEWLVANEIARQLDTGSTEQPLLNRRHLTALMVEFVCDLADVSSCTTWIDQAFASPEEEIAVGNAVRLSGRLQTPIGAVLRGAVLRGADLSHRNLAQVDLTDADLTDAQLVGVNLSGAVLESACLVGARLDGAMLHGVDLRNADLSQARLTEVDLRGAELGGSRWSRAALIDVTADPSLRTVAEPDGAVWVPGDLPVCSLAPAGVGVQFGAVDDVVPTPLSYLHGGTLLAVGGEDGGILVCESATGLPVRTLAGHRGPVHTLVGGSGDAPLASAAADGCIRLWDPATGRLIASLDGVGDPVFPLAMSHHGQFLAHGDGSGAVRLWGARDGRPRRVLTGAGGRVWALAFAPGTELLAAAAGDGVTIWEVATGEVVRRLPLEHGPAFVLCFHPRGAWLVAGGSGGLLQVWSPTTGRTRYSLGGLRGDVVTLSFSPEGNTLATGDVRGTVRMWPMHPDGDETGQMVEAGCRVLQEHGDAVHDVRFSPNGSFLAGVDAAGTLSVWDRDGELAWRGQRAHRGLAWPTAFRPDSAQLATTSNDGMVQLWDTATAQPSHRLRGTGRRVTSVGFDSSGELLAVSGNDGTVRLWNAASGRLLESLRGSADRLVSAVFCPGRPLLATRSNDGGVHLWADRPWRQVREYELSTEHVWTEAFHPFGEVFATANDDDTVRLWNRITGREVLALTDFRGRVRAVSFSSDGTVVATGCDDRKVRVHDAATGTLLASLSGHSDRVYGVAHSPDGTLLASAANDGTARLWDVSSGDTRHVLQSGCGRLWTVAFSPDGSLVATAGDDAVIRLWDPRSGQLRHSFVGHSRRINDVRFSPDGSLLASAADDGTTRLWRVGRPDDPLSHTLVALSTGWLAFAPDGRYKTEGSVVGEAWYSVGLRRFEIGELDAYAPQVRLLSADARF
jgi:WD40 repeat protein